MPKMKVRQSGAFVDLAPASLLDMDVTVGGPDPAPGAFGFVAAASNFNHGTPGTVQVNVPAGTQEGDTLLLLVWSNNATDYPAQAGWTEIVDVSPTAGRRLVAMKRLATASEPASYGISTGSGYEVISILTYRTVGTISFIGTGATTGWTPAPVSAGTLVLGMTGNVGAVDGTPAAGWTARVSTGHANGQQQEVIEQLADVDETLTPDLTTAGSEAGTLTLTITPGGADHVLAAANAGKIVEMSNTIAANFTVSDDASAGIPVGNFVGIRRTNIGVVTLIPAGGVTLTGVTVIDNQNDEVWLHKRAANTWHGTLRPGSNLATQTELDAAIAAIPPVTDALLPAYVGSTDGNHTLGGQSLATPAGAAVGDLLIATVGQLHQDAGTPTGPSGDGWSMLPIHANGTARTYTWWKIIEEGATAASYTLGFNAGYQTGHALDLFKNVHRGAPIVEFVAGSVTGTALDVAAFTDDDENTTSLVIMWVGGSTGYTVTPSNGYAEHRDGSSSTQGSRWVGSRANTKSASAISAHSAGVASGSLTGSPVLHLRLRGESAHAARDELSKVETNNEIDSYTLVAADAGKVIELNKATALNLTVPTNATVPFPVGTVIELWQQGAGQVTVVATGGVTIRSTEGKLKLYGQYTGASLRKRGTDEWVLVGDLVA